MKYNPYFPHDSNARNDPKMIFLKLIYGAKGIGMFWIFIEILRDQQDFKLPLDNGITWGSLAYEFSSTPDETEAFINDCVNKFKLLKSDGVFIWSDSLIERMQKVIEGREQKSVAGKKGMEKRWGNKPSNNNSVITALYQNAEKEQSVITENNKEEYRREEKSIEKKSKDIIVDKPQTHKFIPPTIDEVKAYCQERKNKVDSEKWFDFYSSKGWMIGKNKMKDWKAAVRTWEKEKQYQSTAPFATKPPQLGNFEQRQYDNSFFDKFDKEV